MSQASPPRVVVNRQRLLERFLRYVRIETTADPASDSYPSSICQRDLSTILCEELREMTITDAELDENALVWGTVPATDGGTSPTVALVAHVDTSPEAPRARSGNAISVDSSHSTDSALSQKWSNRMCPGTSVSSWNPPLA